MIPSGKRQSRIIKSIPAPIGGWNARDPISDMDEKDAVIMDNWWPTTGDVMVRPGWDEHRTALGDQVESLMPYNAPEGGDILFAAAGSSIYDATNATAVGSAEVSGLTNARFQHVNFTNSDGDTYLIAVNGADLALYYNGSSWIDVDQSSVPAITGVDTDDFIGVMVHKRRVWFVEKDTLNAWYLPVNAVGGAAEKFSLAGIANLGGYLMAINTWTLDAGQGPDDYWVGVTSEGQAIVYQGTDPASSTTWGLVGVWLIGSPIGRRCLQRYQGDLLVMCIDGLLPLSKALISSRVNPKVAVSDKISGAMSNSATVYRENYGWESIFLPGADMLLVNVPVETGQNQQQYSMNTITGAWTRFTGILSNCWCVFNDDFYFGGDEFVGKFWDTTSDNGSNINADLLTAFNYLGSRSDLKLFGMARPVISSDGVPAVQMNISVNYDTSIPPVDISFTPSTQAVWDGGVWDSAIWGGGDSIFLDWQGVSGIGFCAAARVLAISQGISTRLQSIDITFQKGSFVT